MEFNYYEAGVRKVIPIAYAHNIVLDLWLRLGLIGLIMFVAAMAFSLVDGVKAWRRHPDPIVAALALSIVAVLAGLLATAFLEPFLDEYRLATLFGVSLGMLRAAVTSMTQTSGYQAGQHEMGRTAWS
jgi:O-antigen ligase